MENEKLGQEPAFSCTYEMRIDGKSKLCYHEGMSKRFYAACAAMQGILASDVKDKPSEIVRGAYLIADELLKQENE